jgi:hypothetical protein
LYTVEHYCFMYRSDYKFTNDNEESLLNQCSSTDGSETEAEPESRIEQYAEAEAENKKSWGCARGEAE